MSWVQRYHMVQEEQRISFLSNGPSSQHGHAAGIKCRHEARWAEIMGLDAISASRPSFLMCVVRDSGLLQHGYLIPLSIALDCTCMREVSHFAFRACSCFRVLFMLYTRKTKRRGIYPFDLYKWQYDLEGFGDLASLW